jgi:hypothetical protein
MAEKRHFKGKPGVPGTTFWARKTGPSAHEPLIGSRTVVEAPLAGLSFGDNDEFSAVV